LDISHEKTNIVRATKGIEFLGYKIATSWGDKLRKVKTGKHYHLKRTMSGHVVLSIPKDKINAFNRDRKYGNLQSMKAKHRGALMSCSEYEIVESHNAEIRGFANYYCLARDVKYELEKLTYLAEMSLIKTLAVRNKTSVAQTYRKLRRTDGLYLTYKVGGDERIIRIFRLKYLGKGYKVTDEMPLTEHLYKQGTELTRRMMANQCELCGKTGIPVEVHHIHKLKDLKKKRHLKNWEKTMTARNRKTLILCADSADSCHKLIHQGRLPDMRIQPIKA
jgi:RNA-directed DNA polymerase